MISLRQLWNEMVQEPVPERFVRFLDRLEEEAAAFEDKSGAGGVLSSDPTDGGPNDGAGSISQPLSEAPHNRFTASTPSNREGSQ